MIAKAIQAIGLLKLIELISRSGSHQYIYAINYHCVDKASLSNFEEQIKFFKENYENVDSKILGAFLSRRWKFRRNPGLIISFDDGLSCQSDIAVVLERHGFSGWYMVPSGIVNLEASAQHSYMGRNSIKCSCNKTNPGMRLTDLQRLSSRGHVICGHTVNHRRFGPDISSVEAAFEVNVCKYELEKAVNTEIKHFVWVGGEEKNYNPKAASEVEASSYEYAFTTNAGRISEVTNPFQLGRINVESTFPLNLVRLQLSGLVDLQYARKRKRVNKSLATRMRTRR